MKVSIFTGDAIQELEALSDNSVQCCVTSPPYWGLRDYGHPGQLGVESSPEDYTEALVKVFRAVKRVLKDDGVLWVNLGDSYSRGDRKSVPPQKGSAASKVEDQKYCFDSASAQIGDHPIIKPKDLIGIPWRVAFALQEDGWFLRQDIIWHKPNPMPESVADRCTKSHEYIFMLTKSPRYFFDAEAIKERSNEPLQEDSKRNKRSVWTIQTTRYEEAHFATFPTDIPSYCILASSAPGDTVLDPFAGSGTTGMVALKHGRNAVMIELNPEYAELAGRRCDITPGFSF